MDGTDLAELLRLRHGVLRALVDEPRPRHELVDALSDSKSTVYKGLSQLEAAGLVDRTGAGFAPTLFGVVALTRYDALVETAGYGDLLADLPGDAVDPAALVGATVVRPEESDTERHMEAVWELLAEAEYARGVAPVVSPGYVERFVDILEGGLRAELVLPTSVVETLLTEHADAVAAVTEHTAVHATDRPVPFGVFVTEGPTPRMGIELRDGPLVVGLVTNDTPAALAWATETVERYVDDATPLDA